MEAGLFSRTSTISSTTRTSSRETPKGFDHSRRIHI
jgi:hypothetical protein